MFPKLGEMGLLGVTVPEKWGGLGLGYLNHTIAMEGECLVLVMIAITHIGDPSLAEFPPFDLEADM